jgi:membrane protease YdiL (CAAX protease family)
VIYAFDAYYKVALGIVTVNADTLVFAALAATLGSAIPEEILFRGYLMRSLEGRSRMWSRIAISAIAFTAARGMRYAPGLGLGTPAWLFYLFGVVLPLGLWWGLMRELAGGSVWPSLASHVLLEFGVSLSGEPSALL